MGPIYLLAAVILTLGFYWIYRSSTDAFLLGGEKDPDTPLVKVEAIRQAVAAAVLVLGLLTVGQTANHLIENAFLPAEQVANLGGGAGSTSGGTSSGRSSSTDAQLAPGKPVLTRVSSTDSSAYLTTSAFNPASPPGNHDSTHWQIRAADAAWGAAAWDVKVADSLVSFALAGVTSGASVLIPDTLYYARVAHRDSMSGLWSDFADSVLINTTTSLFGQNAPAGLITVMDFDFDTTFSDVTAAGSGSVDYSNFGGVSGLTLTDWNRTGRTNDSCQVENDATAPEGNGTRVWVSTYSPGTGGTGPCQFTLSFGAAYDTIYVARVVKYSSNWQQNTTEQKEIYVDTDQATGDAMVSYKYRIPGVEYVSDPNVACSTLYANKGPGPPATWISSPCGDSAVAYEIDDIVGQWVYYEELWISDEAGNPGEFHRWIDGVKVLEKIGIDLGATHTNRFPDTYGGAGSHTVIMDRRYARIMVRRSTS